MIIRSSEFFKKMINKYSTFIILFFIILIGAFFRFYNLNWDQNHHLHPDERFLTMVDQAITWPEDFGQYFSAQTSSLNPANQKFNFFVYGTFPLFFTKLLSEIFNQVTYDNFTIFGRFISALFDLLTILFVFLLGRKVFSKNVGLVGAFLYSVSVLPIQLSHFFAVDTFLNFFLIATLFFLIKCLGKPSYLFAILAGSAFGLSMASKISAFLLLPGITLTAIFIFAKYKTKTFLLSLIFIICTLGIFRLTQPYTFTANSFFDWNVNPLFINNLKELSNFSNPDSMFPPGIQWKNTTPIFYPLRDLLFWGLGLPLGILVILSWIAIILQFFKRLSQNKFKIFCLSFSDQAILILLIFVFSVFFYQGLQVAKPMRYFLPIYPVLVIFAGNFLMEISSKFNKKIILVFIILLIWPSAFMSIYTNPNTRVSASEWIYQNIPAGSTISYEIWDDPLPLNIPGFSSNIYQGIPFPLYDPDTPEKWQMMQDKLQKTDYVILSSNRLYGSISRVPDLYPRTSQFYQDLFAEKLGFKKIAEFTSRPSLPIPFLHICLKPPFTNYGIISHTLADRCKYGLSFVDDYADETFTVYDHPKVIIFSKE